MSRFDIEAVVADVSQRLEAGDLDSALTLLESAIQTEPENARLHYMKACALVDRGDIQEGIAAYEESAAHAGEMAVNPLYNLGNLYKELGDIANALKTYQRVLDIDPTMADTWINMGCILDDIGEHSPALDCYDAALKIDDQDPMTWSNRGNTLRAMLKYDEAEQSYRQALEFDEEDFASVIGVGACLVERGESEGLEMLESAYASTRHPTALFELATALAKLQRFEDAVDCFDRLVEQGMNDAGMWNNRAECLAKVERVDDALASFDKSLEINGQCEEAFFGKARLLINQDRVDEARPLVDRLATFASPEFLSRPSVQALQSICSGKV